MKKGDLRVAFFMPVRNCTLVKTDVPAKNAHAPRPS